MDFFGACTLMLLTSPSFSICSVDEAVHSPAHLLDLGRDAVIGVILDKEFALHTLMLNACSLPLSPVQRHVCHVNPLAYL